MPESVNRIKLMNRPSTVALMGVRRIHTTPSSGRTPSTAEITSNMESKLPPVVAPSAQRFELRAFVGRRFAFTPELVSGAVNEYILQRRLAHRNRPNFPGKRLHHVADKPWSAFAPNAHLASADSRCHGKPSPSTPR